MRSTDQFDDAYDDVWRYERFATTLQQRAGIDERWALLPWCSRMPAIGTRSRWSASSPMAWPSLSRGQHLDARARELGARGGDHRLEVSEVGRVDVDLGGDVGPMP
jgi:hypothetical protein